MIRFTDTYLQLRPIMTVHNKWLSKTRFSSTVTDLVLIYESVTSSVYVVRWLTLHSWTLNSLTNADWLNSPELNCTLFLWLRGEPNIDRHLEQFVYYCVYSLPRERACRTVVEQWIIPRLFVAMGTCVNSVANCYLSMDHSGFQVSCQNIINTE
jgi:hypothetical protein